MVPNIGDKMKIIKIRCCLECPYVDDYGRGHRFCDQPSFYLESRELDLNYSKIPSWCPLKNAHWIIIGWNFIKSSLRKNK